MGNRKGQKHYPESIRQEICLKQRQGESVRKLSHQYGISRYAIQGWCGLRPEVNMRKAAPLKRGRPSDKPEDLESKIRRLEMENELLRNFLQELGRK